MSSPCSISSLPCSIISGARLGGGAGESRHPVPLLAAEELVHRHAQRLALDVVERDVDRRDGGGQHAPAFEILAAIHLLPERAGANGSRPTRNSRVMIERADHRLLAAG